MNSQEKSKSKQKKASIGRQYLIVSYLFVGIFLSLIGYIVYFNVYKRDDFLNSPYNKRAASYQEEVIRGSICAADGTVLARTDVDEAGNETRVYPYNQLFAHAVGYSTSGGGGLESTESITLLTSHANPLEQVQNGFQNEKNTGDNLITTFNVNLQQAAYDAFGDNKGAVIVMKPSTGEVLVDLSKPDFDPNTISANWDTLSSDNENSPLLNRSLQGLYPPGSTFKIITSLAYLRQNLTLDGFQFNCTGELEGGGYTIHCYASTAHGDEDYTTAFANSCNSAFAQIGLSLDKASFATVADSLSFNKKIALELPSSASRFDLNAQTADALVMQTAIGQGDTLMTPMHLAMIAGAVANDGIAMTPKFMNSVTNYTGTVVKEESNQVYGQMMSAQEAAQIKELMKAVVASGTGSALNDLGVTIAGKTGSAEFSSNPDNTHSWFVGFSDTGSPDDIVVCVLAENAGAGSATAVPIARSIFASYFSAE
ncbi:MAG: penicillin-binding transpeptidase domain-containing protein [Lachnospiraceae bacterium]|nr:penicillin-binding transpeptidase domain-containing protein [Lachnospiraceae bacterium]